ncbi:MAG: peptidase [Candidatus Competibacteraceae bacterium]
MPRSAWSAIALSLAVNLSLTTSLALAGRDQDEIKQLRETGKILSLETIIANHERQHSGGRLLAAELEMEQNRYVYDLKVLSKSGVVQEFEYDACTGELLAVEREH